MISWQFIMTLFATAVSVFGLTYLASTHYVGVRTLTLSQIGASNNVTLAYFRLILWFCGSLFAISLFTSLTWFENRSLVTIGGALMIGGEMLLALFPARGNTERLHGMLALIMAGGMLVLACAFILQFEGMYKMLGSGLVLLMVIMAMLTILDRKRFLFYELLFIFLSHTSIAIALYAVA